MDESLIRMRHDAEQIFRAGLAAVEGDPDAVEFVPLSAQERFTAVQTGEVDVLIRNTTKTQGRDVGFDFAPTTFYDGQKLMGGAGFTQASAFAEVDVVRDIARGIGRELHSRYSHVIYPAKLWLSYSEPGIEATVGDFYAQLGRGLVFSVRGNIGYGDAYDDYDDTSLADPIGTGEIIAGECDPTDVMFLDTGLPFYEHFYSGGVRDLRGYDDNTLGPKDAFCRSVGGDFKVAGGLELAFPTPFGASRSGTRIALFVDTGYVYENIDAFGELGECRIGAVLIAREHDRAVADAGLDQGLGAGVVRIAVVDVGRAGPVAVKGRVEVAVRARVHGRAGAVGGGAAARGAALRSYRPQRNFLGLISTGDRYAIASRGRWAAEGAWLWAWKDWIDRRFMRRFNELPEMPAQARPEPAAGLADAAALGIPGAGAPLLGPGLWAMLGEAGEAARERGSPLVAAAEDGGEADAVKLRGAGGDEAAEFDEGGEDVLDLRAGLGDEFGVFIG